MHAWGCACVCMCICEFTHVCMFSPTFGFCCYCIKFHQKLFSTTAAKMDGIISGFSDLDQHEENFS